MEIEGTDKKLGIDNILITLVALGILAIGLWITVNSHPVK
jgi:hypothetical protein